MDSTNAIQFQELMSQLERDSDTGAWIWDLSSNQVTLTPKSRANIGLPADIDCDLQRFLKQFPGSCRNALVEKLNACLDGEEFKQEFETIPEQKTLGRVVVSGRPLTSENCTSGVIGSIKDVSELWYQQERYELAIDAGNVGIWEYHWPSDTLHWNQPMYDMFGVSPSGSLNYLSWESALHPDDRYNAASFFQASVKNHRDYSNQFRIKTPDGEVKYIKSAAKSFYDDDGQPIKSIGVNLEVTRLKEQEEALVIEKALSLQRSKLAAIGELAAGIGHEINNPLAIDMGTINMLKEHLEQKGAVDETVTQLLQKHSQSTKRIKSIVLGMRRLVRDDSTSMHQQIDVTGLIENLVNLVGEIYKKEGIELSVELAGKVTVKGHFGELQQVLMNLLSNAKDAVKEFNAKNIRVSVHLQADGQVRIDVTDNGVGIPKHLHKRVFDNFFSTKPSGRGSGIGLGIVRRIVNEHGGEITFRSEVGAGSTFSVLLPCVTEESEISLKGKSPGAQTNVSAAPETSDDSVMGASAATEIQVKKAVVVDDEPMLLQILKGYLEAMGVNCFVTTQPRLALKALASEQYDLLMTDMCMPEMDGLSLIRQSKALGVKNLRYIIMTGGITQDLSPQEQEELQATGDVIYKPFSHDEIKVLLSHSEFQPC